MTYIFHKKNINDIFQTPDSVWSSYLGKLVGRLTDTVPGVGGTVFAVDKSTIVIANFTSDGLDPGTFIYAGTLKADGSYTRTGYPLTSSQGM